jgi:DNA mismatch repair protein MutL
MELPKPPAPTMPEPPKPQQVQAPKGETVPYRIIGQTMDTYILVEQGDALLLIDKHAAHERILFEKLKAQPQEIMSQLLLRPIQADLSQEETGVLLSHSQDLSQLGFTLEDFGGGTLLIRAIPSDLGEQEAEACLSQLAQNYQEGVRMSPETVHDNLLHTIACKAAIKGGRKTAPLELEALVAQVLSRDDIKYCPHGRPVCITLTRAALERQFKRA